MQRTITVHIFARPAYIGSYHDAKKVAIVLHDFAG
jgi:hypothetical protein